MKQLLGLEQNNFAYSVIYHSDIIDDLSHSQRFTTLIKDVKNGQYRVCNQTLATRAGIPLDEYIGLTVHDIGKLLNYKKSVVANTLEMDNRIATGYSASIRYTQVMPISDRSIYVDEIVKKPLLGHRGEIVGIFGYGRDITPYVDLLQLFRYYQQYYPTKEAIQFFLNYLKLSHIFHQLPTKRELEVLLTMRETASSKHVARKLNLSPKTIDENKGRLRNNLRGLTLSELLAKLRVRHEYNAEDIIL